MKIYLTISIVVVILFIIVVILQELKPDTIFNILEHKYSQIIPTSTKSLTGEKTYNVFSNIDLLEIQQIIYQVIEKNETHSPNEIIQNRIGNNCIVYTHTPLTNILQKLLNLQSCYVYLVYPKVGHYIPDSDEQIFHKTNLTQTRTIHGIMYIYPIGEWKYDDRHYFESGSPEQFWVPEHNSILFFTGKQKYKQHPLKTKNIRPFLTIIIP